MASTLTHLGGWYCASRPRHRQTWRAVSRSVNTPLLLANAGNPAFQAPKGPVAAEAAHF